MYPRVKIDSFEIMTDLDQTASLATKEAINSTNRAEKDHAHRSDNDNVNNDEDADDDDVSGMTVKTGVLETKRYHKEIRSTET